ncbi:hypothetical protein [Candidatus Enterococcus clewellii]|uniref:Uncharacterized protein n=1 Tax=Candidatus Enterococcus clewellii TaxID=1834193 RepID=A0A242K401_9ENTE|nr:hypothetical protein [Enterococcus sp. 9E7_DIV0242]OTP13725.1 hypothetical protein A5888_003204 [Enterococcus sp. 9E7_DIV0242]
MRKNAMSYLVSVQSVAIGLWLAFHHGKLDYTNEVRGFQHLDFVNSWPFYSLAIVIGLLLIFSLVKKKSQLQKWSLVCMNAIWSAYTAILIINELSGVPNMSWALFLGYNVAIYLAARYEVDA